MESVYVNCGSGGSATTERGVWYTYAGDNSQITMTTCNTIGYDSRLTVYSGSCGAFTCVATNDDMGSACTSSTYRSQVTFNAFAGATYYILVHGFQSGTSLSATGDFVLTYSCGPICTPAAANDECASAAPVTIGTPLAASNTCATPSTVSYPTCGNQFGTFYDVWHSFNSGANTLVELSAIATSPAVVGYALYTGTCSGTLTQVACSTTGAVSSQTLTANTAYLIRVFSINSAARGAYTLNLRVPCITPTNVNVTTIATDSATLNWTASTTGGTSAGFEYEVRTSGAAGSGATGLATTGSVAAGITTAAVSGLTPATAYTVYVRSNCSIYGYSNWTSGVSFTTACTPATSFSENFDTVTTPNLPPCWSKIVRGTSTSISSASVITTSTNFSSPNGVSLYNSGTTASDDIILVSPILSNVGAGTHQLRFRARASVATQDVIIGTLNTSGATAVFTPLQTVDLSTTYTEFSVPFTAYTGTNTFIGMRHISTSTFSYIYLDNISWEPIPTCFVPTAITATLPTTNGVTLGWTTPTQGTPTAYQYEIRTSGAAGSGNTGLAASGSVTAPANSVVVSGLNPSTNYSVYV
ncbi:MAG: fibronectin type III domain-containing protein, partial [Cytophagaceae bacterium]